MTQGTLQDHKSNANLEAGVRVASQLAGQQAHTCCTVTLCLQSACYSYSYHDVHVVVTECLLTGEVPALFLSFSFLWLA